MLATNAHTPSGNKGTAGHWIQQGGKWVLIHAVGPGQWAQGPKAGFKSPPKPHGAPSTVPNNPLTPMSPTQITQQAKKTVSSAYKPAFNDLNAQSSQEQAIYNKQQADNQYYMQWLNAKSSALQTQQTAVDQQTSALEQQLTGNQQSTMGAQSSSLIAAANARAGNVTNNAQSNAFGAELAGNQQNAEGLENAAATHALGTESLGQAELGSAALNTGNALNAGAMQETSNFNTAMKQLATTRAGELDKRTSDIQKEVARLQGVAINVAENNRSFDAAAQKLGLSEANTASEIAARQAGAKNAAQRLKLSATEDQLRQMNADRQFQLDKQKYNASTAKDIYEREHGLGPYKQAAGSKPLSVQSQNVIYGHVNDVMGELRQLMNTYGDDAQQAYHDLMNGATKSLSQNKGGKTVFYNTKRYTSPDTQILNAAYNLVTGNGLSPGDVNALKKMGLANPGSRFKIGKPHVGPAPVAAGNAQVPGF